MTAGKGSAFVGVGTVPLQITTSSNSSILQNAIVRYTSLIYPFGPGVNSASSGLTTLKVLVASDSESLYLGVNESYTLSIPEGGSVATLSAPTVWGALHGLESFSQLITSAPNALNSYDYYIGNVPVTIEDSPRFSWRGLLIDSARHYLDVNTILRAIEAMSYAKLNVLHWHAVDAQSFPVISSSYPLLSKGAYAPSATFSHADISQIVSFAKSRGIRVVVEFDMPGHAASWGVGYPNITAVCPASLSANINNVPLNPTIPFTYQVISGLFTEMTAPGLFDDQYLHIGGDEVVTSCWTGDPAIAAWMASHGFNTQQLEQYFETQVQQIVASLGKTPIVWQEIFQNGITLPQGAIVEVWKDHPTLQSVINAGYHALYAAGNYLDQQIPNPSQTFYEWVDTWKNFYTNDPLTGISGSEQTLALVLGGEAAMWGEQVDSLNFDSRVWPRASAVAERLWSPATVTDLSSATARLAQFRCTSLAQRGIGAGPIQPDYCPLPQLSPLPRSASFK